MKGMLLIISLLLASAPSYANRMVEAEYIVKISQHYDDVIEKSKLALAKTQDIEIEKVANKFITAHLKEKRQLEKLRLKLYSDVIVPETSKTRPDLERLQKFSGKELDQLYLELMTKHFRDAIVMTSSMLPEIKRLKLRHMAIKMIKNKGNELEKIEKIKKSL